MSTEVQGASFIPYRRTDDGWEFFLQMRDSHAPVHPNIFSVFGGHIEEGEDSKTAVLREIQEELTYTPKKLEVFPRRFTSSVNRKLFDLYIEEVGDGFESGVRVMEGEYGAFLSAADITIQENVSAFAKEMVEALLEAFER